MLEDISFDGSNDKLVWGSIFTGIGFSLGLSCLLVRCLCRTCHKRKKRRPVIKVLGTEDSDDDTTSSSIELTPEPVSDATTDDEPEEEVEVVVAKDTNQRPLSPRVIMQPVNVLNTLEQPSRPRGVIRLTNGL
jgi:hypothetical protein